MEPLVEFRWNDPYIYNDNGIGSLKFLAHCEITIFVVKPTTKTTIPNFSKFKLMMK